jgi:hypothetical protein
MFIATVPPQPSYCTQGKRASRTWDSASSAPTPKSHPLNITTYYYGQLLLWGKTVSCHPFRCMGARASEYQSHADVAQLRTRPLPLEEGVGTGNETTVLLCRETSWTVGLHPTCPNQYRSYYKQRWPILSAEVRSIYSSVNHEANPISNLQCRFVLLPHLPLPTHACAQDKEFKYAYHKQHSRQPAVNCPVYFPVCYN